MESVARYAALVVVRYSGAENVLRLRELAVGTSTVVLNSEEVRYWEGPLSEVPPYTYKNSTLTEVASLHKLLSVASKLVVFLFLPCHHVPSNLMVGTPGTCVKNISSYIRTSNTHCAILCSTWP